MLQQPEIVSYLLQRGLLPPSAVVDGDVKVVDASRRNRNFKIVCQLAPSYLVKQAAKENSGGSTIAYESGIYQRLNAIGAGTSLSHHLPRHYAYDREHKILILELVRDAASLHERAHEANGLPSTLAASLGTALSAFHRRSHLASQEMEDVPVRMPWVLSVHEPTLDIFRDISAANLQLIRIVQNTLQFPELLDELRRAWRVDALIHNDLKWDNCLTARKGSSRGAQVKIVDWEFAGRGDASWDVGSIFSNYLSFWLSSIPFTGEGPADQLLDLARCPLKRLQPAMRSFWSAYRSGMELSEAAAAEILSRCVRYAGARLIQTGFEQMQQATRLSGNVVYLLQLSWNILRRPQEALAQLAGIDAF